MDLSLYTFTSKSVLPSSHRRRNSNVECVSHLARTPVIMNYPTGTSSTVSESLHTHETSNLPIHPRTELDVLQVTRTNFKLASIPPRGELDVLQVKRTNFKLASTSTQKTRRSTSHTTNFKLASTSTQRTRRSTSHTNELQTWQHRHGDNSTFYKSKTNELQTCQYTSTQKIRR